MRLDQLRAAFFHGERKRMRTVGIVCEYNPFHSGHAYQIEQIRKQMSDAVIVCLMSGHATQRGELAIADRYTRAAMAIAGGANVVLELPYPYSAASAAYFAGAGVAILDSLGVQGLSFGCECTDLMLLHRAASMTRTEEFWACVLDRQKGGEGSAAAYFSELQSRLADSDYCFLANDILALEYMRSMLAIESDMQPMPIHRDGSAYRAQKTEDGKHPSATALRKLLLQSNNEALSLMPISTKNVLENAISNGLAPGDMKQLDAAILSFFRLQEPTALAQSAEMQGGLSNRLHDAAMRACSVEEMLTLASSKSYPTARLRRAILYAMTGVTVTDLTTPPAYVSLLSADAVGRELLRYWKGSNTPIPIVTKPADAFGISPIASRQASLSLTLDALFALTLPRVCSADRFVKMSPRMF